MRVYKPTRKGPRGAAVRYSHWYVELRVGERMRRLRAFTDRGASEELGRKLERLASLRSAGEGPDRDLVPFLERLPSRLREKLADVGLLERRSLAATRSIEDLADEWREALQGRSRSESHVTQVVARAKRVLEGSGARTLSEIDALRVERFLSASREGEDGISAQTANHWLAAARQFTRWTVRNGLAAEDPLRILERLNVRVDRRHVRRALSPAELQALLAATTAGPDWQGLSGPQRALLYRLAAETGLRKSELASLRTNSFESLDGDSATVTLRAGSSKRRREDVLPLRPELARALAAFLVGRAPWEPAFGVPKFWRAAEMIADDLKAAGIAYEDEGGRVADFHSLRVSFVTALARAGVAPKVAQSLARHSDPRLTFNVYSKLGPEDERRALDSLPDLMARCESESARATGTKSVASCVAFLEPSDVSPRRSKSPPNGAHAPETAFAGAPGGIRTHGHRFRKPG